MKFSKINKDKSTKLFPPLLLKPAKGSNFKEDDRTLLL